MSTSNINPIIQTHMLCEGCKLPAESSDDLVYSCNQCNYHLHLSCTKFPQLITHPSQASHSLTLLPVSTYPGGLFICDACKRHGDGFSYHCNLCDFDLHVVCASKTLSIVHHLHNHLFLLTFKNPYKIPGFSCDICLKLGSKQWFYQCGLCEYDAHLHCATGTQPPPLPPQQSVRMKQSHVQPKPGRPSSGTSGRMQGSQSFLAMANQPGTRISDGIEKQQSVPEAMGFEFNGMTGGIQMQQQNFPAEVGIQNHYYGSGMQRQQIYPLTAGGGMQSQQSDPVLGRVRMQPQQIYPGTGKEGRNNRIIR